MKNSTQILIVLDRSGSMGICRGSTIEGLNTFIRKQKESNLDGKIKLVQFDSSFDDTLNYDVVFNTSVESAPELTYEDFQPRGGTPLYDAQAKAIDELGSELRALPESDRPEKVIIATITDGENNTSKKETAASVKKRVEHQTSKYNWDFVYIGANQDAIFTAQTMGIGSTKALNYNSSSAATVGSTFRNFAAYVVRDSVSDPARLKYNSFTEEERSTSMNEEAETKEI